MAVGAGVAVEAVGLLVGSTVGAVAGMAVAVGLLARSTVEAVAGMAVGMLPTVAWPTWVMGGVAMQ